MAFGASCPWCERSLGLSKICECGYDSTKTTDNTETTNTVALPPVVLPPNEGSTLTSSQWSETPSDLPRKSKEPTSARNEKRESGNKKPLLIGGAVLAALALVGGLVMLTKGKSSSGATDSAVAAVSSETLAAAAPETTPVTEPQFAVADDTATAVATAAPVNSTVQVPDVIGSSEPGAKSALSDLGLTAKVIYDYSATIPQGYVVRQNPTPGQTRSANKTVELVVSQGAPPQAASPLVTPDARTTDSAGRTAEDAFRVYYDLFNRADYEGAFALESGDFGSKISVSDLANWNVRRAEVQSVRCDGKPEFSFCNGHVYFKFGDGSYSDERTQVGMRIVNGFWTLSVYKVEKAVKRG
jgi:PASTA domain